MRVRVRLGLSSVLVYMVWNEACSLVYTQRTQTVLALILLEQTLLKQSPKVLSALIVLGRTYLSTKYPKVRIFYSTKHEAPCH
jgi:hypothetical protein